MTCTDWLDRHPRFDVVYHITIRAGHWIRFRLKVQTNDGEPVPTVIPVWRRANWAEREVWDLFGIEFDGHPDLRRLHAAGGMDRTSPAQRLPADSNRTAASQEPTRLGDSIPWSPPNARGDTMVLNMGPHHPSTHGVLRLLLELDGETVVSVVPDIGYLHTGIEKTGERLKYQQVITLTDRMGYLDNMLDELAYVLAAEKLLGIEVPERVKWIRVLLGELERISSHCVWLGTHALDLGALSMFMYGFREREKILDIKETISGVRMMTCFIPHRRFDGRSTAGVRAQGPRFSEDTCRPASTNIEELLTAQRDLAGAHQRGRSHPAGRGSASRWAVPDQRCGLPACRTTSGRRRRTAATRTSTST